MRELLLVSESPQATHLLGHSLGRLLFPRSTVALTGPLGAGKTFLVRAVADGLGIADPRLVSSPTFVLIQEYAARLPIYHFDAYRLADAAAFADLGVHEYFSGNGVCIVEWADRVMEMLPDDRLEIDLQPTGEQSRRIRLLARGSDYERLLVEFHRQVDPSGETPAG
jgi:tRNA threonylcarbamoyladenosine biosynthesis protein TsaE